MANRLQSGQSITKQPIDNAATIAVVTRQSKANARLLPLAHQTATLGRGQAALLLLAVATQIATSALAFAFAAH